MITIADPCKSIKTSDSQRKSMKSNEVLCESLQTIENQ